MVGVDIDADSCPRGSTPPNRIAAEAYEVVERLDVSMSNHLRTFDLHAEFVDRIGDARQVTGTRANHAHVEIPTTSQHLLNIDNGQPRVRLELRYFHRLY